MEFCSSDDADAALKAVDEVERYGFKNPRIEHVDDGACGSGGGMIGVDPGSLITGWGLIGGSAGRPAWLDAGAFRLGSATNDLARRLCRLQQEMERLVLRMQPTCAAVEAPYHGPPARSAQVEGEVGIRFGYARRHGRGWVA